MEIPFPFVTAYGKKTISNLACKDKSLARQSMKDECDINFILKQYNKTGLMAHSRTYEGEYGEFAAIDYHEAMNTVVEAQSMFETVPSEIRSRFGNDPGAFLKFVLDEKNSDEMRDMGLMIPKEENKPPDGSSLLDAAKVAAAAGESPGGPEASSESP